MAAITITPGNVSLVSGSYQNGTAGATITAGMPIYKDSADSDKLKPSQQDTATHSQCDGIAVNSAASGQPVSFVGDEAVVGYGAILTAGEVYSVGAAAGGICPHGDLGTGEFSTVLGVAVTTSNLKIKINESGVAHG
jgi:hypothetical protein